MHVNGTELHLPDGVQSFAMQGSCCIFYSKGEARLHCRGKYTADVVGFMETLCDW